MSENGNKSGLVVTSGARVRTSGPILILAVLFIAAVFLSWYFTWFGRGLSDTDISKYLADETHPRHVQHALLQIQERLEKGDTSARQWYPRIISLAANPETEFRLTVAWLMGSDNRSPEFHKALVSLLQDSEPIVRRNAALALLRFNDPSGRRELLAILDPHTVAAPREGLVASTLQAGSPLTRGTLLARIHQDSGGKIAEVRSPLPGEIEKTVVSSGARVNSGDPLLMISSDDESIWEALRGLAIAGEAADLPLVKRYQQGPDVSERISKQASLTAKAITTRTTATK